MSTGEADADIPLVPAATVVLLRDGEHGIETLMLKRSAKVAFGGMWVFPGGRIDADDFAGGVVRDEPDAVLAAAHRAAVRETREETGLEISPDGLVWFAHWTAPANQPRRFVTWFFAAEAPSAEVMVDGGEIHDHAWMAPTDAHRRRDLSEIVLAPPTWVTLHDLANYPTTDAALEAMAASEPEHYATRIVPLDDGHIALWHGDAGYDEALADRVGRRHRLTMQSHGWRYERDT